MLKKKVMLLVLLVCAAFIATGCAQKEAAVPPQQEAPYEEPSPAPEQEMPAQVPSGIEAPSEKFLTTQDGYKIAYTFYDAGEGSPAVILLHMYGKTRADWDAFAKKLQNNGFSAIAIDLRGHGESQGEYKNFFAEDYNKMTYDVEAAKKYLLQQDINTSRIAIIGASIGANIALNYAAKDPDIKGIVLLSPGLDYHGIKTEDAMKSYGRPVLIVASVTDQYAASSSHTLYDLSHNGDLKLYKVAGHGTEMLNEFTNLDEIILSWLRVKI